MKTTIEIADSLFERVRGEAHKRKTTIRALTEEGLRLVLAEKQKSPPKKTPPVVTFGKNSGGVRPEFKDANWNKIRDEIYGS